MLSKVIAANKESINLINLKDRMIPAVLFTYIKEKEAMHNNIPNTEIYFTNNLYKKYTYSKYTYSKNIFINLKKNIKEYISNEKFDFRAYLSVGLGGTGGVLAGYLDYIFRIDILATEPSLVNFIINGSAGIFLGLTIFSLGSLSYCIVKATNETFINTLLIHNSPKNMAKLLDKIIMIKKERRYTSELIGYENVPITKYDYIKHDCPKEVEETVIDYPHGENTISVTCPICKGEGFYYEKKIIYDTDSSPIYSQHLTGEWTEAVDGLDTAKRILRNRNKKYQSAVIKHLQNNSPQKALALAKTLGISIQ